MSWHIRWHTNIVNKAHLLCVFFFFFQIRFDLFFDERTLAQTLIDSSARRKSINSELEFPSSLSIYLSPRWIKLKIFGGFDSTVFIYLLEILGGKVYTVQYRCAPLG
ncbi:Uncharacterized protein Rs2_49948 [Raphanus sativus]|nr:Uncharacterized protein Rs2_49948 [Raphanus sativus]